jgi:transposase InsO family protein
MSRSFSISARRCYGVQRVCRNWRIARSSVYHRRPRNDPAEASASASPDAPPRRRGPRPTVADEALLGHIRRVLAERPFCGEGYRKVHAVLRHEGVRVGHERVLGLMREHDLLAPHRTGRARGPLVHDGSITPDTPDTIWGTDMTSTLTGEGHAAIFIAIDHCTAECIGIHAARRGTRFEALEPIRQAVRDRRGAFAQGVAGGITLRHDHGSQYTSDDFQHELAFLGIASSPSFVRQPEGNGCAERFIRTLKENLLWLHRFDTVEQQRQALIEFMHTDNTRWLIQRHGYKTPNQYHADLLALTERAA